MIVSKMTNSQIDDTVTKLRDALRKNRSEFSSEAVQQVLRIDNLGVRLLEPFRKLVEEASNLIVWGRVKVDRSLTLQEVLKATGRKQYLNPDVVANMPQGEGDEVELIFFNVDHQVTDDELEKEYELHSSVAVDPYSLAVFNAANPEFADRHPNATHWKDASGKWCSLSFSCWRREGDVVFADCAADHNWRWHWWYAGVRCK